MLSGYLRGYLIWHLRQAGRLGVAEAVACDLRWAGGRLEAIGSAAVVADLAEVGTARAVRMLAAVTRAAHLLAPAEPPGAVVDVLHSRLVGDPDWGPQVTALRDSYARPRLVSRWRPPDLPDPAQLMLLKSDQGGVSSVCPVTVDGRGLPASGDGRTVRIWDPATGEPVRTLEGHQGGVWSVCPVTVDGRDLLASSGDWDGTVRIWDPATGEPVRTLKGHQDQVNAVCPVTVDGRDLLASGSSDRTVLVCDPATAQIQALMRVERPFRSCAQIGPRGLAAGGDGGLYLFDYLPGVTEPVREPDTKAGSESAA